MPATSEAVPEATDHLRESVRHCIYTSIAGRRSKAEETLCHRSSSSGTALVVGQWVATSTRIIGGWMCYQLQKLQGLSHLLQLREGVSVVIIGDGRHQYAGAIK